VVPPDAAPETLRWLAIHPPRIAGSPQQTFAPLACSQYTYLVNEVSVSECSMTKCGRRKNK
jgi:hypothetical protein